MRRIPKSLPFRGPETSMGRSLSSGSDSSAFALLVCTLSLLTLPFVPGFGRYPAIGMTLPLQVVIFAVCCRIFGLQPRKP